MGLFIVPLLGGLFDTLGPQEIVVFIVRIVVLTVVGVVDVGSQLTVRWIEITAIKCIIFVLWIHLFLLLLSDILFDIFLKDGKS